MAALPLTVHALHKSEMEYHRKFGHTLGRIQHISLMSIIGIFMQPDVYLPKLWHLSYLVSKVSSDVFNIWLFTNINPYFILITLMMYQISLGLHGVGIKFNTTQPRVFRIPSRCRLCQNYQQKKVRFMYYTYSAWFCCLLEYTDSTIYSI